MPKALVFIADGFEEIEALTSVDLLRRGGVEVETVSVGGGLLREGAHRVTVTCDRELTAGALEGADMLVLPGGWPGAENLCREPLLRRALPAFAGQGKWIGAICAAPYALGDLGLLRGKKATCYPGFEEYLAGAEFTGALVEKDGNIITGRGPGAATEFALALVAALRGEAVSAEVRDGLAL